MNRGLTALQECLDPEDTERGLAPIEARMRGAGLNLEHFVRDSMQSTGEDGFVFLDAGCGAGHLAEEFALKMPARMAKHGLSRPIRAIGLDLNPLPSPLYKNRIAHTMKGDVVTMEGIPSGSIDFAISVAALQYVEDHLQALYSGWQVLKPGGMMLWQVHDWALTVPPIQKIFRRVQPADLFEFHERGGSQWIICRREPGVDFHGFPYQFQWVERPYQGRFPLFMRHMTVSHYDFKSPSS